MEKKTVHPNSLANLKSWKPGQSGNPEGTKGPRLGAMLKSILDKELVMEDPNSCEESKKSVATWLMMKLVQNGMEGKEKSLSMILDRIDGSVQKNIKLDASDTTQINIIKDKIRSNMKPVDDDSE